MNKKHAYGLTVALFAAAVLAACNQSNSPLAAVSGTKSVELKTTDMVEGSANAPATIIEFASMTCPHCAAFQKDVIPLLKKDYIDKGTVKLVFREYPLDGAARMASAVARCLSGDQYFSFIDLLFKNQVNWIKDFDGDGQLTREDVTQGLTQMGRFAGLSADKVKSCGDDPTNLALVDANWMEGMTKYNVNSTPTFIINGTSHSGEIAYPELQKILDPLIKK